MTSPDQQIPPEKVDLAAAARDAEALLRRIRNDDNDSPEIACEQAQREKENES